MYIKVTVCHKLSKEHLMSDGTYQQKVKYIELGCATTEVNSKMFKEHNYLLPS